MLTGPRHRREDDARLLLADHHIDPLVERHADLRWVVIDDLVGGVCELAISPWPVLGDEGRLTFAQTEDDYAFGVINADRLLALVRAARALQLGDAATPELVDRPLRVGDAFAARVAVRKDGVASIRGGADGIGDLSARARVFAKVQEAVADRAPLPAERLTDHRARRPRR